ncbi:MAG: hydrogenase [Bacillales bacterium]|jgi:Ni/Fe-hydrogenase 1 B-type cytochrome subunit|nr:hydrogenase [Bacillales bacterium]
MSIPTIPNSNKPNVHHEHIHSKIDLSHRPEASYETVSDSMIKIYVWELPVRIFHWVNALAILLLMVTGIYIGNPFVSASVQEDAYYSMLMGWVRYIHFFSAFVFIANLIFRWYWVFKGNKYATSNPLKRGFWSETFETVKFYALMKNKKPHYVGHNPLAQLAYWIFIGLGSIVLIITGLFLYVEPQPESLFGSAFIWTSLLFGGDSFTVRSLHHLVAWGIMVFIVIHVYLSFREDWLEKNGTMSSIVTGFKTESKHVIEDQHDEEK